ncbi:MAG: PepSY domain-containing protein [Lachnospiraceae bacterium]|nr:PepSY domain-containing protein [Lachnospiraceae bacterium]
MFGTIGRVVVDIVAGIIILLSLTGIILFCIPYRLKWRRRNTKKLPSKRFLHFFRWNNIIHNKVGYATAIFTIIIAFTGMCLRPPLMIPLVLTKTSPIPGTAQDNDNYWHDKMRGIRWDAAAGKWLISTSDGFIHVDKDFKIQPIPLDKNTTPPISPMGITTFENIAPNQWYIGSFSGLFYWNNSEGTIIDLSTGKEYDPNQRTYGLGNKLVSGMSRDLDYEEAVVFDYAKGAPSLPEMSDEMKSQPMSLWNTALELHVGRCYTPFLGPFSELFVFTFGLLLTLVLVSGVIIHIRQQKKSLPKNCENTPK